MMTTVPAPTPQTWRRLKFIGILSLAVLAGLAVLVGGLLAQGPRLRIATFDVEGIPLPEAIRAALLAVSSNGLAIVVVLSAILMGGAVTLVHNSKIRRKLWTLWAVQLALVVFIIGGNIRVHLHRSAGEYVEVLGEFQAALYAYAVPLILEIGILGVTVGLIQISRWAYAGYKAVKATEYEELQASYAELELQFRLFKAKASEDLLAMEEKVREAKAAEEWLARMVRDTSAAEALVRREIRALGPKDSLTVEELVPMTGAAKQTVATILRRLGETGEASVDKTRRPNRWSGPGPKEGPGPGAQESLHLEEREEV